MLITHDTHRPSYAIAMVADALASNRLQAIGNYHADVIMFIMRVKCVILHRLNKQCAREVERSATRQFLWYWRVRPLTTIMYYVMFITCQWKLCKFFKPMLVYKMRPYCKQIPTGFSSCHGSNCLGVSMVILNGSHWIFTQTIINSNLKKKSQIDLSLTGTRLSLVWWGINLVAMGGQLSKQNKMKLFHQHIGTWGTKLRQELNQNNFHPWMARPFGDACQGNASIWVWLKSVISVWCFCSLGLQRRYRAFGPPSPNWKCIYFFVK